ncbi:hypothetical protein RN001_009444 [Aquatica leii]|uniref:Uncharacterized protein n=1 Tax=Aquatica leii TaxID=1421715 RepID=A0AAN7P6N8_9COLE|nr:hypothetical protein RN001_009444 [Aquatica leii]
MYNNAHGDISSLIEDLGNGPNHVFSDHSKCKKYYCGELMGETAAEFNETRASGLFRLVQGALSLVIRKADSLIDNETNNRAELFMSVLARFNGKRLNLIQKYSFQTRSYLSPGNIFKRFMVSQTKYKRKLNLNSTVMKKSKKTTSTITNARNIDYGPLALEITPERRDEIVRLTVGQFDNILYRSERSEKLTASNFGAVIKRRIHTSCHSLVKTILLPQYFSSEATDYGKINEAVAISLLEDKLNIMNQVACFWM